MKIAFGLLALVAGAPFVAWMVSLGKGEHHVRGRP